MPPPPAAATPGAPFNPPPKGCPLLCMACCPCCVALPSCPSPHPCPAPAPALSPAPAPLPAPAPAPALRCHSLRPLPQRGGASAPGVPRPPLLGLLRGLRLARERSTSRRFCSALPELLRGSLPAPGLPRSAPSLTSRGRGRGRSKGRRGRQMRRSTVALQEGKLPACLWLKTVADSIIVTARTQGKLLHRHSDIPKQQSCTSSYLQSPPPPLHCPSPGAPLPAPLPPLRARPSSACAAHCQPLTLPQPLVPSHCPLPLPPPPPRLSPPLRLSASASCSSTVSLRGRRGPAAQGEDAERTWYAALYVCRAYAQPLRKGLGAIGKFKLLVGSPLCTHDLDLSP